MITSVFWIRCGVLEKISRLLKKRLRLLDIRAFNEDSKRPNPRNWRRTANYHFHNFKGIEAGVKPGKGKINTTYPNARF